MLAIETVSEQYKAFLQVIVQSLLYFTDHLQFTLVVQVEQTAHLACYFVLTLGQV